MDIEKLIERLKEPDCDECTYEEKRECAGSAKCVLSGYAAEALSTLQAENEKLRAELERVKRERDSALKDLERLCRDDVGPCEMAICELCAYNSGVQCSSSDRQICDGYNVFNWKWRGPQKED